MSVHVGTIWALVVLVGHSTHQSWVDMGLFDSQLNCNRAGFEWTQRGMNTDAWHGGNDVVDWKCKQVPDVGIDEEGVEDGEDSE